jgi:UDP-glucose:(heptosyl)LPS alpha-1,3-glucosyltransferase
MFPHGGLQRDALKLARECLARGHAVTIYCGEWRGPALQGARRVLLPARGLSNHAAYARFHRGLAEALREEPADLLVGMNKIPGLDVYFAGDSCYLEKAAAQRPGLYRLLPRYRRFAAAERAVFAAEAPTRIFALTERSAASYRRWHGTPAERFHLLPPDIDVDRIAGADAPGQREGLRQELGMGNEERLLLLLGSGFRKKGLDRVLDAMAAQAPALRDRLRLCVIGDDRQGPFERQARRLGLSGQVRFLAGRDDVPRFLFAADALLLPAYDELAGMVILEAMVAGLPVLLTANCGYAPFVEEAEAGLVLPEPFEQPALNAALTEILTSPRRAGWSSNGRAMAHDHRFQGLARQAVDLLECFHRERHGC